MVMVEEVNQGGGGWVPLPGPLLLHQKSNLLFRVDHLFCEFELILTPSCNAFHNDLPILFHDSFLLVGWTQGATASPTVAKAGMYVPGTASVSAPSLLYILNQALPSLVAPPKLAKLLTEEY